MRDEISFRSLQVKNSINNDGTEENQDEKLNLIVNGKFQEMDEDFLKEKKDSSISNLSSNININNIPSNNQNKNDSKKNKVKENIKEYFKKNKQLNKKDFDSFLSFIGLRDIWSDEEEQMILWESIISKAKNKDNIDYDAVLDGINELFEDDDDEVEEIVDKKSIFLEKMDNSYLDVSTNENCIDEYLNSIKDNIELLFGIKFINEIFLKNCLNNNNINRNTHYSINTINTLKVNSSMMANGINVDLDKSDIEGDNEEIKMDSNKSEKKTIINTNDIFNEINTKYRFIMISKEELNNYFNNLNKNNTNNMRRSISSNNLILKNEKKQEYSLDKELINYVSAMIELKLESKIKSDNNENNDIINENDSNKNIDNEDIKEKENNEIKNENILEQFFKLDIIISDCYEAIINNNSNKDLMNLIKIFNENYVRAKKKILYDNIKNIILNNKKNLEIINDMKEKLESKNNINESQNINKSKFLVEPNDENNYLKQQIENLKERNEYLQKENSELKENISKNFNEISLKNNKIKISKLNLSNNALSNNINFLTQRNIKHNRYKTVGDDNLLNNIINQNNLKNSNTLTGHNLTNESDSNINNSNNINNYSNNINNISNIKSVLQYNKTGTNSFLDFNIDEITNSRLDIFSEENNTMNDKFLFETTQLGNETNIDKPGTPTLTPRSNILDNKDTENSFDDQKKFSLNDDTNIHIRNRSRISDINYDHKNYNKNLNIENNKRHSYDKTNEKNMIIKKSLNLNNFNKNKFSFGGGFINTVLNENNFNFKYERKNNCDFKYLCFNKKVSKLLMYNNEKLKSNEIFSEQIFYILNGNKKKKGLLLITSQCFYILDDSPDINCVLRISHKLLSSISIPKENFNHLLISFNEGCFIIIEIYRRIYLLNYLKDLYLYNKYKKINVYYCDSFNIKLANNHSFIYEFKNNKDIIFTPNFENAQKVGFLQIYKENFFSAYFTEKLIVLCSIGLIVFSKSDVSLPKLIIPLIGTSIKIMNSNTNEKLHCFRIKTINNETFIFGSNKVKEVNDWVIELKYYQKVYESKMNEVMANFVVHLNNN